MSAFLRMEEITLSRITVEAERPGRSVGGDREVQDAETMPLIDCGAKKEILTVAICRSIAKKSTFKCRGSRN